MSLSITSTGGGDYPTIPLGLNKARCVGVIDLGTQEQTWQGETSYKHQVFVQFEVPTALDKDSNPLTIGKFYNANFHEKSTLSIDLTSWNGKPLTPLEKKNFNFGELLGRKATINIMEKDNGKQKISSVMPCNEDIAEQYHTSIKFNIEEYQKGDKETFNKLDEWFRNKILESKELGVVSSDSPNADKEEQVPF
jgi:hypothetical protein